jgi:hypothetical protein
MISNENRLYSGELMRRSLSALLLASLLVTAFPASIPATFGQHAAEKSKKAAASVSAQRGIDTISANQNARLSDVHRV